MARPRLGEEERRTRTVGVRVMRGSRWGLPAPPGAGAAGADGGRAAPRGGGATGAEPDRGESQSNGAGAQLGSRVVACRDPGGGGAGRGAGG